MCAYVYEQCICVHTCMYVYMHITGKNVSLKFMESHPILYIIMCAHNLSGEKILSVM